MQQQVSEEIHRISAGTRGSQRKHTQPVVLTEKKSRQMNLQGIFGLRLKFLIIDSQHED